MIQFDGRSYFPYVLFTEHGQVIGLDPRPAEEIERAWLEAAKRGAEREALQLRASARSDVHNLRLLQRKVEGESVIPGVEGEPVALDEVAQPPAATIDADEVIRLSGLPDGYGFVAMIAGSVSGVARAGGEAANDFCAGVDTWLAGRPGRAPGRKGGKGPRGKR